MRLTPDEIIALQRLRRQELGWHWGGRWVVLGVGILAALSLALFAWLLSTLIQVLDFHQPHRPPGPLVVLLGFSLVWLVCLTWIFLKSLSAWRVQARRTRLLQLVSGEVGLTPPPGPTRN
jgi:hypothetical protein